MSKREDILARLVVICSALEGVTLCARNRDELSDRQRPAVIILDADEVAIEGEPKRANAAGPQLISMTPEIYILISGTPESVGTELNTMRDALRAGCSFKEPEDGLDHSGVEGAQQRRKE